MSEDVWIAFFTNFGGWVGLLFSVIVFSSLLGDHRLARLAQYLLVGLSMGYLALLAVQYGLRPLTAQALLLDSSTTGRWLTLLLAMILFAAGCERIFRRGRGDMRGGLLRWLGMIPLGLMVGVGVATLLIGVINVTIVPQTMLLINGKAIANSLLGSSLDRLLVLILSAGVLFHLTIHPERHLSWQSAPLRQVMLAWMWIGQRALWLAAGIFFARIFAARYSLLIALLDRWWLQLQTSGAGAWIGSFWGG